MSKFRSIMLNIFNVILIVSIYIIVWKLQVLEMDNKAELIVTVHPVFWWFFLSALVEILISRLISVVFIKSTSCRWDYLDWDSKMVVFEILILI